ncbi:MAG: ECF transporter S component [Bacillota bacterium]|nr:ECF transporter S component [Bacillota bacterium]
MKKVKTTPTTTPTTTTTTTTAMSTNTLVMYALLTAIVIVLQLMGSFIKFGPFSVSLVLMPIVIGAALCGPYAGAWLGFVFGMAVLFTDSGAFLAVNTIGTIIVVLLKGVLAGLGAGLVYSALQRVNTIFATFAAAITGPVINTGVFIIGCRIFFMDTITQWASSFGFASAGKYMLFGLVGGNFIFELLINIVLSPVIVRLIQMRTSKKA